MSSNTSPAASNPAVELYGYADRISARPGDRLTLMTSTTARQIEADVLRFVDGSPAPPTAPAPSEVVPGLHAEAAGRLQHTPVGSRADLPLPEGWDAASTATLRTWLFATTPRDGRRQVVLALGDPAAAVPQLAVTLVDGYLALESRGAVIAMCERQLRLRTWYGIAVLVRGLRVSMIITSAFGAWFTAAHDEQVDGDISAPIVGTTLLRLAAWRTDGPSETLNGKIAAPAISAVVTEDPGQLLRREATMPEPLAATWEFTQDAGSTRVVACAGNADGRVINAPTRAMTGPFWSAQEGAGGLTPNHDAIHFHTDDVGDLQWEPTIAIDLPDDLRSGIYAVRLRADGEEMHVPFTVTPAVEHADVAFLVPTNTYLAYANHRMFAGMGTPEFFALTAEHPIEASDRDRLVLTEPQLGRSLYDLHEDGSGVSLVSWRRPVVNLEPAARDFLNAGPRHFAADLYLVGWLERTGLPYVCVTDEALHRGGVEAIRPFRTLVTGSHPEYWSRQMINALQEYLLSGGKVMYMGGNGFYWVTSLSSDCASIEVRRGLAGSRAWNGEPGESVHATTAEPGGLWRTAGICPQSLVGVGMAAQGWGGGVGYRRLPDSHDPMVAPFFNGIEDDEVIGNFGHSLCGAAGDEVDRIDYALGTPPHALHLATSETLPDQYQLTVEEVRNNYPAYGGTVCEQVRSDLVWFDLPGGGEVFSVGSVNWAASLGWNAGRNNVDVLTTNVLRTMLDRDLATAAAGATGVSRPSDARTT
jgi:N,N-dimethylformamidase